MRTTVWWMLRTLALITLVACSGRAGEPVKVPAATSAPMTAKAAPPANDKPAARMPAAERPPATRETAEATRRAKQWDECGRQYTELASSLPSGARPAMLGNAASCYALGG